ncbi:F-box/WD repeat-containing protein 2-like isoform X2 [Bolinopsis microptera]|uniref:F-box/WD repeat-containing protein 2-like isoform X2 n=1 Tax=Bolinopsis microptera TaxID=2820187 RepID=UPI0030794381
MSIKQELLGRLPANNRLFLVRNIERIATVDYISELPDELSLVVLRFLDPTSLLAATQVSKYWNKLINSECMLWRELCFFLRISLKYSLSLPASHYRDKILSYQRNLHKLKQKNGCVTRSVSDVSSTPAHTSRTLALSANTNRFYSGGDDRFIRCWDRTTFSMISEREGMAPSCIDCTETIVAAGSYNGCVLVYDTEITRLISTCSRHMGPVYHVKCSTDSSVIVSGSSDCTVRVWVVTDNSSNCKHVFRGHETMINKIVLLDERVFSLDIACIKVWNVDDKKMLCDLKPLSYGGKEGYFQPGLLKTEVLGRTGEKCTVVVCGSSHGVYMWEATTYNLLRIVKSGGYVCAEQIVGVGSAFIAATYDDGIALINNLTGHHELTIQVPQFNNTSCGLWLNDRSYWLDGRFEDLDSQPLFTATTLAGDISSFYIKN